MTSIPFRS